MIQKGISQNLNPKSQKYTSEKEIKIQGTIFLAIIWKYKYPVKILKFGDMFFFISTAEWLHLVPVLYLQYLQNIIIPGKI
jgi:hypothetical protein